MKKVFGLAMKGQEGGILSFCIVLHQEVVSIQFGDQIVEEFLILSIITIVERQYVMESLFQTFLLMT